MKKIILSLLMSTFLFSGAIAAEEKVYYSSASGTLTIPKIYVRDASGDITSVISAELTMIKASEPYELQVKELGSLANGTDTDEFGCVLPQTWHAAMGHCMVQN